MNLTTCFKIGETTIRLTERQTAALKRLGKTGHEAFSGELARQLEKKGLAIHHGEADYERWEWNRVVARLRKVNITPLGKEIIQSLASEVG